MTRQPFEPREIDGGGELTDVASELESYTRQTSYELPHDLADRIMASVAEQPIPRRGLLAMLTAPFVRPRGGVARMVLVAGTMALAVLAVVIAGQLGELFRNEQIGPSPEPSVLETPLVTLTPSPSPSATTTPEPSPSAPPTATLTPAPSVAPSPSDDDSETPEPSRSPDDDESETPRPSDDDNSGPGGGSGDDSS